jgi:hypothetical protein
LECPLETFSLKLLKDHSNKNHCQLKSEQLSNDKLLLINKGQDKPMEMKTKGRIQCAECNFKTPYPKRLEIHLKDQHPNTKPGSEEVSGTKKLEQENESVFKIFKK